MMNKNMEAECEEEEGEKGWETKRDKEEAKAGSERQSAKGWGQTKGETMELRALLECETPQMIKCVWGHRNKLSKLFSKPTSKTKKVSFPKHSNIYNSKELRTLCEATMSELRRVFLSSSEVCRVMEEQTEPS